MRNSFLKSITTALALMTAGIFGGYAGTIKINPENIVIIQGENDKIKMAVQEFKKHLKLVTGTDINSVKNNEIPSGKYPFYIGIPSPDDKKELLPEEACWTVMPDAVYLYGNDTNGNGTLFAVYGFLEEELGIRWTEPGDIGIAYKKQNPLQLKIGNSDWKPQLAFRTIRPGIRIVKEQKKLSKSMEEFQEFMNTLEADNKFAADVNLWQKRMRMGGSRPGGGHSFTEWWVKYGKTHPEYFALNKLGKREPVTLLKGEKESYEFIKICPSNPGVAKQIVENWLPKKDIEKYVGVCLNDGGENFCECAECKKLDVMHDGEKFAEHLSDRYIYLANVVARKVRNWKPGAVAVSYAYLNTLEAPRKQKLEPNIVVHLAPYAEPMDLTTVENLFKGWYDAGGKQLAFRPNYHFKYHTNVIPIGDEKQMFDVFQTAVRYGTISADYDSLMNNWPVTGMADYVLAKSMSDPSKPFEYWENDYCKAYGDAAEDVKGYFHYWRNELWEKRLIPNIQEIAKRGGAGDFARGLMWSLKKYYTPEDFEKTDVILQNAAKKNLTEPEKDRLKQLILANQHAHLIYNAVVAEGLGKCEPAKKLFEFRKKHKDDLRLRWISVFANEVGLGDITGLKLLGCMNDYVPPWFETDLVWRFMLDPENKGLEEKWQEKSWEETGSWEQIRTDKFWENQCDEKKLLSENSRKMLAKYDGIAWYSLRYSVPEEFKNRKIFLRFGAVDESCWVYVNGKLAGEHIFKTANDWKTPFEIQIDPFIDWNKKHQLFTVRVEDKGGVGGIWKRVCLVSKKSDKE